MRFQFKIIAKRTFRIRLPYPRDFFMHARADGDSNTLLRFPVSLFSFWCSAGKMGKRHTLMQKSLIRGLRAPGNEDTRILRSAKRDPIKCIVASFYSGIPFLVVVLLFLRAFNSRRSLLPTRSPRPRCSPGSRYRSC